ncbi:MAG: ComEA family DNA-binding protein [Bacteroidota bacterium]|jgi:competence protein ComEA
MKRMTHEMKISLVLWLTLFFLGFLGKSNLPEPEININAIYEHPDSTDAASNDEMYDPQSSIKSNNEKKFTKKINLNFCDTSELRSLYINSRWANKIIEFRTALGGYYHINQLMDIYGFPEFFFEKLYYQSIVSPSEIAALGINEKSEIDLMLHPYLSKKDCHAIVNYRREHGPFSSLNDIYQIKTIDSITIKKIEPYLAQDFLKK